MALGQQLSEVQLDGALSAVHAPSYSAAQRPQGVGFVTLPGGDVGWISPDPTLFAALVLVAWGWLLAELGWAVAQRIRKKIDLYSAVGKTLLTGGLLLLLGWGLANCAMRFEGMIIMSEGQVAPLSQGAELQELELGLLSDPEELDLVQHLDRVELHAAGGDTFSPVSHLRIERDGGPVRQVQLAQGRFAREDQPGRRFSTASCPLPPAARDRTRRASSARSQSKNTTFTSAAR